MIRTDGGLLLTARSSALTAMGLGCCAVVWGGGWGTSQWLQQSVAAAAAVAAVVPVPAACETQFMFATLHGMSDMD